MIEPIYRRLTIFQPPRRARTSTKATPSLGYLARLCADKTGSGLIIGGTMPAAAAFTIDDRTTALLRTIENTEDEGLRQASINELSRPGDRDAARVLMETFERTMWRTTRLQIVRALGPIGTDRPIEFLMNLALQDHDLGMAAEALLALGNSRKAAAGEFLAAFAGDPACPVNREAVMALSMINVYPCEEILMPLLGAPEAQVSHHLRQYMVLALGRRDSRRGWPYIRALLEDPEKTPSMLFNAALVAAGRVADEADLPFLEKLDTRYRFFAHQLKAAAVREIHLRRKRQVEDLVTGFLACGSEDVKLEYLRYLKHFPGEQVWAAFKILASEAPPTDMTWARTELLVPEHFEEDVAFVLEQSAVIDSDALACLCRAYELQGMPFLNRIVQEISLDVKLGLWQRLRDPEAIASLLVILEDPGKDGAAQVEAVNALVAQCMFARRDPTLVKEVGDHLARLINDARLTPHLRGRMIRAWGQIGHQGSGFHTCLRQILKSNSDLRASAYSCLSYSGAQLPAVESAARVDIIRSRLRKIAGQPDPEQELTHAVKALARIKIDGPLDMPDLPLVKARQLQGPLLRVMVEHPCDAYLDLVKTGLASPDHQRRMLAIAAARRNMDSEIALTLLELVTHENLGLAERAMDSLAGRPQLETQLRLIERLASLPGEQRKRHGLLKVLRTLVPEPDKNHATLVDAIEKALAGYQRPDDDEVTSAAVNLIDNLKLSGLQPHGIQSRARRQVSVHDLDRSIQERLDISRLSELIRSVLRNAELTSRHPELFDERVDKSTVLVEYVKSIDLYLQEKIGAGIFLHATQGILAKMQSRIVALQLDDDSIPVEQRLKDLQCFQQFTPDAFPAFKMNLLCQAILNGRIIRDQYRMIDGLRAWAIMLLLFGRSFKYRQAFIHPILPVADADNRAVCAIAADLNQLQHQRNQAAHRGTMLDSGQLVEIRNHSLDVLGRLMRIVAPIKA